MLLLSEMAQTDYSAEGEQPGAGDLSLPNFILSSNNICENIL
ncbi:hypothetical protein J2Z40_001807 [Cytobacillus eiseniae]|uniref:Uncharacterized protein n=1 Tax=Cytobacillus eiseniae TaxID=762947 RepID=A0ABS4RFV2_9BACI|nr:hypothetical protein [Cytobacillus eiseniae]